MYRVLIVDVHSVYRKGLRAALETGIPAAELEESETLEGAARVLAPDGRIDLVLVELQSAGVRPLDALGAIRARFFKTRFAAMAAMGSRKDILRSLEAGLHGFIHKLQPESEILRAIQDILSGRVYVPPSVTHIDTAAARRVGTDSNQVSALAAVNTGAVLNRLTPRQRDLVPLIARGMSNKEIARALKIAEGTTKIHASSLFRALRVRNRTEAAAVAQTYLVSTTGILALPNLAGDLAIAKRSRLTESS
jgi:DNA-binding NarL/FixJ family response regulator